MKAKRFGLAALVILAARTAVAEPVRELGVGAGAVELEASAHLGVASAPFDVATLPEAKGQALVFGLGARSALSERLSLEVRLPFVLGSVAQPAGSYVDAAALGTFQLGARYELLERRSADSVLTLAATLGIGVPFASHAEDLMPNRLLAVADGIEGRGHPEWFTPGVLPLTAASVLGWESGRFRLLAELRLPLLVRVSDADLPEATADPRRVGFAAVVGGEACYRLSRRLSLASAAHLFFDVVPAVAHVREVSRVQDFERLGLHVHFGVRAALSIELQTAIGGELGGSMVAGGLRWTMHLR